MKSLAMIFVMGTMAMCAFAAPRGHGGPHRHAPPPPRHHHHHHHNKTHAIGAGILGAGLIASTIYNATRPSTVVVSQSAVVTPAPVVVAPAPVVVQQPVVATGHYETRIQNVWVEGRYVDQVVNGVVQRVWQPGHYEQQQTQVWVTP